MHLPQLVGGLEAVLLTAFIPLHGGYLRAQLALGGRIFLCESDKL